MQIAMGTWTGPVDEDMDVSAVLFGGGQPAAASSASAATGGAGGDASLSTGAPGLFAWLRAALCRAFPYRFCRAVFFRFLFSLDKPCVSPLNVIPEAAAAVCVRVRACVWLVCVLMYTLAQQLHLSTLWRWQDTTVWFRSRPDVPVSHCCFFCCFRRDAVVL
jgi:hypothetical protein